MHSSKEKKPLRYGYGEDHSEEEQFSAPCMVCVGGAPQPPTAPDVIKVSEEYPQDDEKPPFNPRDVVRIRTNAKFENFYDIDGEPIGEGKFGKVYRCTEKQSGLELAAKFIKIRKDADREQVEHEVAVMTQMRHPRIAQIYDAFYSTNNDVILVMELVKGGELFNRVVEDNYVLTETAAVMVICQLCEAIDYIHSQNIVHLDIKPENIMCVSETGNRIKLIDFGLARHYDGSEDLYYMAGTPEFSAPEVIKFEPLDFHTDMWSVGVITYILLSGYSPFLGETTPLTYVNVERGEWEFIEEFDCVSEEAKDFISNLLVYDKSKRMLPKACLSHPWIAGVRDRIKKDIMLDQPNVGPAIPTDKLKRYNIRRKFRKATFAVMSYCEFSQILTTLRKKNSEKGVEFFSKVNDGVMKKKKKKTLVSVLAPKNKDQAVDGVSDQVRDIREATSMLNIPPTPLEDNNLRVDRKVQKAESSESSKENKVINAPILKRQSAVPETSKKVLVSSDLPPKPSTSESPRKKSVKKPKISIDDSHVLNDVDKKQERSSPLRPAVSAENVTDLKENAHDPLKKTASHPLLPSKSDAIVKLKKIKTTGSEEITKKKGASDLTTDKKVTKSSFSFQREDGKPKKLEIATATTSKSVQESGPSNVAPKVAVKTSSLIAARLQKLNVDDKPLTFNVTGKKFESPVPKPTILSVSPEMPHSFITESESRTTSEKKSSRGKELEVVTEKKRTTTTTTSVKSKVQNSEKKLTTSTNDKKIEETKHKSSKTEQVKVSSVTTAEEKCPETGKKKTVVVKNVAKQENVETAENKNRREEQITDDKTTVKSTQSNTNRKKDSAALESTTKVDGALAQEKKLEFETMKLRRLEGNITHEVEDGKKSVKDAELSVLHKMKQSLRGVDNGKEEKTVKEAELKSTVTAERTETVTKEGQPTGEKKKKRRVITRKDKDLADDEIMRPDRPKRRVSTKKKDSATGSEVSAEKKSENKNVVATEPTPLPSVSALRHKLETHEGPSAKSSLFCQLNTSKDEEHHLKSALKQDGAEKRRKTVKLSDIILPNCKLEEGTTKVKFASSSKDPLPSQPSRGFGLQKGKSEGNIAVRAKNNLKIKMSTETKDDQNVHKRHWLLTDEDEEALSRPREDYTFASLKAFADRRSLLENGSMRAAKEKLERRVLGDPLLDMKKKETIKIPNANIAMNKWKQLERTG